MLHFECLSVLENGTTKLSSVRERCEVGKMSNCSSASQCSLELQEPMCRPQIHLHHHLINFLDKK